MQSRRTHRGMQAHVVEVISTQHKTGSRELTVTGESMFFAVTLKPHTAPKRAQISLLILMVLEIQDAHVIK